MFESIKKIFGLKPPIGSPIRSARFRKIESNPKGQFTFYVGDNALTSLREFGIEFKDIEPLPQRIFDKCCELGLGHKERINFIFDIQEELRDPS